jgi:ribosomal protein S4
MTKPKRRELLDNTGWRKRGKKSEYAIQLMEKKAKYSYGILEKQFKFIQKHQLLKVTGEVYYNYAN